MAHMSDAVEAGAGVVVAEAVGYGALRGTFGFVPAPLSARETLVKEGHHHAILAKLNGCIGAETVK